MILFHKVSTLSNRVLHGLFYANNNKPLIIDQDMRYYNLKNEENGVSIWVDVQLTNMNYHFVEWSIGRIQMDRPHFLLAVKKTESSIKAFMPFDWPFCELFEIDNNSLRNWLVEDKVYYGYFSSYENLDEEEGIIAFCLNLNREPTKEVISRIHKQDVEHSYIDSLGKQNLFDTPTATWICYYYDDEDPKERECSLYKGNIQCCVVGASKRPDFDFFISQIKEGDTLLLKKEPDNPVDSHAIAVYWKQFHVGYICVRDIPIVALCMDNDTVEAGVSYIGENGTIDILLAPTLQKLGDPYYNEEYGPFYAKVKVYIKTDDSLYLSEIYCSIEKFKEAFYYEGPTGNICKP